MPPMKETLEHTLEYLYAPVWPDNAQHVIEQGLHDDDETGFMLVNKDTYAVGFINLTGGIRLNGVTDFEIDGKTITAPAFDKFQTGIAMKIKVADLDLTRLTPSSEDFSAAFYPQDMECYTYFGHVPASAIVGHVEYKLDSPDIPMKP